MGPDRKGYGPHRLCHRVIAQHDIPRTEQKTALAMVADGSEYVAVLRVLPTFGCVLHELGVYTPKSDKGDPEFRAQFDEDDE